MKENMKWLALSVLAAIVVLPATARSQVILKASVSGSTLTISGTSLGTGKPTVSFGGGAGLALASWTATQVVATMPAGVLPGTYELKLTKGNGASTIFDLTVGAVGPIGPQGLVGPQGPAGTQGPQGLQGLSGMDGINGFDGLPGPAGPQGPQGLPGIAGAVGATGTQGLQGTAGASGAMGPQGPAGLAGPQGLSGATGAGLLMDGRSNTAGGNGALRANLTGIANTVFGESSLKNAIGAGWNSVFGLGAMGNATAGEFNTAIGATTLQISSGNENVAVGYSALNGNTTGRRNIGVGSVAGSNNTVGNDSIFIGNQGAVTDDATIRIGTTGRQTSAYIAGVAGHDLSSTGVPVVVTPDGRLGTGVLQAGPQGPQGPQGFPGINGFDGLPGPAGPQGAQGVQGLPGAQGLQGASGIGGAQGPQGIPGSAGVPGPQGLQGPQGAAGMSVMVASEPAGPNCANGGAKLIDGAGGFAYVCGSVPPLCGGAPLGAGQTCCGGVPTITSSDPNSCGACGVSCGTGGVCSSGVCAGPGGSTSMDMQGTWTSVGSVLLACGAPPCNPPLGPNSGSLRFDVTQDSPTTFHGLANSIDPLQATVAVDGSSVSVSGTDPNPRLTFDCSGSITSGRPAAAGSTMPLTCNTWTDGTTLVWTYQAILIKQ